MLNRLQKYSRKLREANQHRETAEWRGQSLVRLTGSWGDNSMVDTDAAPEDNWLRRGVSKASKTG